MKLNIDATPVFDKHWEALKNKTRYILHQGGTRSSKTISILQSLILTALTEKVKIDIVRNSFPTLRGTAMSDFFDLLNDMGLYIEGNHNRTQHVYKFKNGSTVEFFSLDSQQKVRGRKRDILFMNEGNEVSIDIYKQLAFRTTRTIIIDFNPSDADHWIYELSKDTKSVLIKSTYKDNPFIGKEQKEEIEKLILTDDNYYRIYALGEAPTHSIRIYSHFKIFNDSIDLSNPSDIFYGLDFGYNDPNVLIECKQIDGIIYVKELIYKSGLTAVDLCNEILPLNIGNNPIYADTSRPEMIEELKRVGLNVKGANKSIKAGIDYLKSTQIYIHEESVNVIRENKLYSWRSKDDKITDEPVDKDNHAMDALRYGIFTHKKKSFNPDLIKFY